MVLQPVVVNYISSYIYVSRRRAVVFDTDSEPGKLQVLMTSVAMMPNRNRAAKINKNNDHNQL